MMNPRTSHTCCNAKSKNFAHLAPFAGQKTRIDLCGANFTEDILQTELHRANADRIGNVWIRRVSKAQNFDPDVPKQLCFKCPSTSMGSELEQSGIVSFPVRSMQCMQICITK
jgi:hypothetical protein